jgi:hypothetical protein
MTVVTAILYHCSECSNYLAKCTLLLICPFFYAHYVGIFMSFLVGDIVTTSTNLFTTLLSPVEYLSCLFKRALTFPRFRAVSYSC